MEGNSGIGSTRRFGGAVEDVARRYWIWRKRARACLRLLQVKSSLPETLGSAIFFLFWTVKVSHLMSCLFRTLAGIQEEIDMLILGRGVLMPLSVER